jgi:hypothetical protein
MFNPDRIFSQRNTVTGEIEWFFSAREGTFGPYANRVASKKILDGFVAQRIAGNDDGGRNAKSTLKLSLDDFSLETRDAHLLPQQYEPLQRKKGKES